ncbi:MAG: DUF4239 domain-containing protein [Candidatus Eremiobacteraeota bacterium]|nr:DUF4239 domain-containing protein [Candidatus Eremiobacteraeota bacterium]
MIEWFESLPTAGSGLVVVGGFVLFTLLLGWVISKLAPNEIRIEHNDLAGFILAVIGVVYAVLLAFVAIGVWERFQHAEVSAYEEAGSLLTVYRDADSFPNGHDLRLQIKSYVDDVISDEWPKMSVGSKSEVATEKLERIDKQVRALHATSPALQDVQAQMLEAMEQALTDRELRLSEGATGINSVMWAVLILGAVLTVGFTYLFGFRHSIMQHLMIGALGAVIGLVLFLTIALDFPYRGAISVSPEAFISARETFAVIGP